MLRLLLVPCLLAALVLGQRPTSVTSEPETDMADLDGKADVGSSDVPPPETGLVNATTDSSEDTVSSTMESTSVNANSTEEAADNSTTTMDLDNSTTTTTELPSSAVTVASFSAASLCLLSLLAAS